MTVDPSLPLRWSLRPQFLDGVRVRPDGVLDLTHGPTLQALLSSIGWEDGWVPPVHLDKGPDGQWRLRGRPTYGASYTARIAWPSKEAALAGGDTRHPLVCPGIEGEAGDVRGRQRAAVRVWRGMKARTQAMPKKDLVRCR